MRCIFPPGPLGISQLSVDFVRKPGAGGVDGSLAAARLRQAVAEQQMGGGSAGCALSLTGFGASGSSSAALKGLLQAPCAA